jgi:hypothetical protein
MPICSECGIERTSIHRHHVIPRSQGGTEERSNIRLLCANCHEDTHGGTYGGPELHRRHAHTPEANAKRAASMRRAWAEGRFASRPGRTQEQEDFRIERARQARAEAMTPERERARAEKSARTRQLAAAKLHAKRNRRIKELAEHSLSASAIGDLVGCSTSTVSRTLKLQREGLIP